MATTIILIGFMGSGKTTVGELLAQRLGWPFYDADQLIEEQAQASIATVFARQGEASFRQLEQETVIELLDRLTAAREPATVALGGGAVTVEAIHKRLVREPRVIFIEQDLETAFERSQDGNRPLARDRQNFEELYGRRQALYRGVAKYVVTARNKSADDITEEIIELLSLKADAS